MLVADSQCLIDDQHVGLDGRDQCKRQPHHHAGRIGLDRAIDGLAQLRKFDDGSLQRLHLGLPDSDQAAAEKQVVAAAEFGVEAGSQLQDGGDPPGLLQRPHRGLERPGDQLEQSALARAVVPHHTQALAAPQFERNPAQGPLAAVRGLAREERRQPLPRRVVEPVFLAQILRAEYDLWLMHRIAHSQSANWSRLRLTTTVSAASSTTIQPSVTAQTLQEGQAPCSRMAW